MIRIELAPSESGDKCQPIWATVHHEGFGDVMFLEAFPLIPIMSSHKRIPVTDCMPVTWEQLPAECIEEIKNKALRHYEQFYSERFKWA